jgi:hypothetical protein
MLRKQQRKRDLPAFKPVAFIWFRGNMGWQK